jgi:hypothetical protein
MGKNPKPSKYTLTMYIWANQIEYTVRRGREIRASPFRIVAGLSKQTGLPSHRAGLPAGLGFDLHPNPYPKPVDAGVSPF